MEKKTSSLKTMLKGFGAKQQTKDQYIKNFMRTSKKVLNGFNTPEEAKYYQSNLWFKQYAYSSNDYSMEQLLNPKKENLKIDLTPKPKSNGMDKIVLTGYNGIWRILLHERSDKSIDFDIAVCSGKCYRFHSEVIKQSIQSGFGIDVYNQWRALVKSDQNSLKQLIHLIQSQINFIPWSYTCSQSSARLCEQVGISTYRGAAFLFPASYR